MKLIKLYRNLVFSLAILCTFPTFAQWQKQNLPVTQGFPHMQVSGSTAGKNVLWLPTVDALPDSTRVNPVEFVRTADGGKTYQKGIILPNNKEYYYVLHPFDATTAYLSAFEFATGVSSILRTVDGGATWQILPYHSPTFLDATLFYDAKNGIIVCDPDSLGAFIAYTTDGGNTFTRIAQTNLPRTIEHEGFFGAGIQVVGNNIFLPTVDIDNGFVRMWRSTDRGRNWTAGAWFSPDSPFGPTTIFTDSNNGFMLTGIASLNAQVQFYTTDGGKTWQESSGSLPGRFSGGYLSYIPNTQVVVGIFEDLAHQILFSAASNDYGKTWNSRKDLVPYKLDSIYVEAYGIPPFAWTNLEIVDNHTAWAKFSRTELYRYDSPTPIIAEIPDLELTLKADNDGLPLYGYVKYTLSVRNRGISNATGVKINWLPPYKRTPNATAPYAFVSSYSDKGRYDSWNGVWELEKLDAGAIATASFHLFVLDNSKDITQTAQVTACNEKDLDSSPNNMSGAAKEDDEVGFTTKRTIGQFAETPITTPSVFSISPNPTTDKINVFISNKTEADWSVKVLNTIGQTIFTQNGQYSRTVEIDAKNLQNGLYIVEYQADGERKTEKVLVQH